MGFFECKRADQSQDEYRNEERHCYRINQEEQEITTDWVMLEPREEELQLFGNCRSHKNEDYRPTTKE